MSSYQPSGQVVVMKMTGFGTCAQCNTEVSDGAEIRYWHSGIGKSYDRIISCPSCARPKGLLPERLWIMEQLERLHTVSPMVQGRMSPLEITGAVAYYTAELDGNYHKMNSVLVRLLQRLPKCEECNEYALFQVRNGPYFCESHIMEHPTAQKVEWAPELVELGVGSR